MERIFQVMLGNHHSKESTTINEQESVVIISDWDLFMIDLERNYSKEDRETILKHVRKEDKNGTY